MNLLKSLQQTQTQRAQQPLPGQVANLRKMLSAKSGKAGATSGPAISNVQEQQALADFGQQATTQQQAAQVDVAGQQQQQAQQRQQGQQAQQRMQLQGDKQQQQFDQAVEQETTKLDQFKDDLASKEGKQALSEALFARSLADKEYLANLQREGQTRRLEDAQSFQFEAGKMAFENWKEVFGNEETFQKAMDLDHAEFAKEVAQMDINAAMSIVNSNIEAANRRSMYEAGANFVTGTIQAGTTEYGSGEFDAKGNETQTTLFQQMGG